MSARGSLRRLMLPVADTARWLAGRIDSTCACSFAQEGEDLVLRRLIGESPAGFYVDVGAHHPRRFSNTNYFYISGWRGINIEPSPDAIALFQQSRPRDINVQVGIADKPGTLTYYLFDEPALNTFDTALKRQREAETPYRCVGSIQVPVERLDSILSRHVPAGQAIDFMSVDVEGLDLHALRSNDWQAYRPRFVLAEALDFSLDSAAGHPMQTYMHEVGYELVAKTLNTLFYRDRR